MNVSRLFLTVLVMLIFVLGVLHAVKRLTIRRRAPRNTLEVFRSRPVWKKLPLDFLTALANKLRLAEKAIEFAQLCEKTGILKNNIVRFVRRLYLSRSTQDPEFAVGLVAATLTSYANAMGDQRQFKEAKRALELALLLRPRHIPAWASMALVAAKTGDYKAAFFWADKVLAFKPHPNSKDFLEIGIARFMTPEGEKEAAEAFGEQGMIGAWKKVQEQMKELVETWRQLQEQK